MEEDNKEWNPKDWQGRSKRQVIENYKIMDVVFSIVAISFMSWVIYTVVKNVLV
jgi:hypothetical protein